MLGGGFPSLVYLVTLGLELVRELLQSGAVYYRGIISV